MTDYPYATFRIELGPGLRLGPGKVRLLELIAIHGSISAAAREMGMSYRRAWLLVEESNRLFAVPLVDSVAGGPGGGGARLTEAGHKAIAAYREIEREAAALVNQRLGAVRDLGRGKAQSDRE
jgi:molybdate transport system regulatory protein